MSSDLRNWQRTEVWQQMTLHVQDARRAGREAAYLEARMALGPRHRLARLCRLDELQHEAAAIGARMRLLACERLSRKVLGWCRADYPWLRWVVAADVDGQVRIRASDGEYSVSAAIGDAGAYYVDEELWRGEVTALADDAARALRNRGGAS